MHLDRPIFVVGTGRCGSTAFHNAFTLHPEVSFLSGLCVLYPKMPRYNYWAMRLMDVPVLQHYARKKFRPAEHWPFWDEYVRGFSFPCRDLVADDVRPNEAAKIRVVLEQQLTRRRRRLLVKLTGWPRVGFLSKMFEGALFVHVVRDGRAVVNSTLNVDFWQGWGGPSRLGLGELTENENEEWEESNRSFVVLAAIQWKRWMDAFEAVKRDLPSSQFMEIRYANLVREPVETFKTVLAFCGLSAPPTFMERVRRLDWRDNNSKWRQQLTAQQQSLLSQSLEEHLVRYKWE